MLARLRLALIVLYGITVSLASPVAADHDCYFVELIENRGAEDGTASPDGNTVVPVPGWTTTGNLTVVAYNTGAPLGPFPTDSSPGSDDRALQFFAGGPGSPLSAMSQTWDLASLCSETGSIDAGHTFYELRAWLGGTGLEEDHAAVGLVFRDAGGGVLLTDGTGPVTAADRGNQTGMIETQAIGGVPPGTRQIELAVTMIRLEGDYNDAYADDLSLWLFVGLPVEPSTWGAIKQLYR